MATQVQIRGSAQATQEARTLASRELDINTTDWRLAVHNGSTAGGIPHLTCFDSQNQEYTYGAASGTDTITISMAKAPAAYQAGQRFTFKAANTNTGSATLNVNSLGAKTLKKKDVASGTITILSAGDIIQGGIYTVFYDGTDMLFEAIDGGGLQSVSQGDLNTSTGTWNLSVTEAFSNMVVFGGNGNDQYWSSNSATGTHTLPSGGYGFGLQGKMSLAGRFAGWVQGGDSTSYTTEVKPFFMCNYGTELTFYGQVRYVTASPPINMGDGDMAGFIFVEQNENGETVKTYAADVPPWLYNGKTSVRPDYIDRRNGKKYRKTKQKLTIEQILDGAAPEFVLEEITQEIKNADMPDIPHPFGSVPDGHKVILLDTQSDVVKNMIDYQNAGGGDEVQDIISNYLKIDTEPTDLISPLGVTTHKFRKK